MGTRETDQTVADDRASVVRHSVLEDVSHSDAESVRGKKVSMNHITRQKSARLKPDLNSTCEFGGIYERTIINRPALSARLARFDDPPLLLWLQ